MDDNDILLVLEYGGVDNWDGYEYAREMAEEDGLSWSKLSPEEQLDYLDRAGVDNWGWYSESINNYLKDYSGVQPTPQEYVAIFESIPSPELWSNYDSYKSQVAKFEKELSESLGELQSPLTK